MESWREAMSEFKFACPICGQHITAGSNSSGTQIECPTCFQKIVVPQAPAGGDSKLILSAAQANRPRPSAMDGDLSPLRRRGSRASWISTTLLLVLLCAGGGVLYTYRARVMKFLRPKPEPVAETPTNPPPVLVRSPYPVPTNTIWTLDLNKAVIPQTPAAGRIHGSGFLCERATLTGGALSLRQGNGWPPDLAIGVLLSAQRGEDLSGKSVTVAPISPIAPRLVLRWKDEQAQAQKQELMAGYALKVVFGQALAGKISGKIFVSVPDDEKSFVAGTFEAEIKKPQQATK